MRIKRINNNFVIAQVPPGKYWNKADKPVSALFPHFMYVIDRTYAEIVQNGISFEKALNERISIRVLRAVNEGHELEDEKFEEMFNRETEFELTN